MCWRRGQREWVCCPVIWRLGGLVTGASAELWRRPDASTRHRGLELTTLPFLALLATHWPPAAHSTEMNVLMIFCHRDIQTCSWAGCGFHWFLSDVNISFPRFLQQQYLRSEEEGKEEVTLQLLLNVSAQCGVCFPCNSSPTTTSIPLVHAVRDETLLEVFTSHIWFPFICNCNLEFI